MKKIFSFRKLLSIIISMIMCISAFPVMAMAETEDEPTYRLQTYAKFDGDIREANNDRAAVATVTSDSDGTVDIYYQLVNMTTEKVVDPSEFDIINDCPEGLSYKYSSVIDENGNTTTDDEGVLRCYTFTIPKDTAEGTYPISAEAKIGEETVAKYNFKIKVKRIADVYTVKLVKNDGRGNYTLMENSTASISAPKSGDKIETLYLAVFKNAETDYIKDDYFTPVIARTNQKFADGKVRAQLQPIDGVYRSENGVFKMTVTVSADAPTDTYKIDNDTFELNDEGESILGSGCRIKTDASLDIAESTDDTAYEIKFTDEEGNTTNTNSFTFVRNTSEPGELPDGMPRFVLLGDDEILNISDNYKAEAKMLKGNDGRENNGIDVFTMKLANDDNGRYLFIYTYPNSELGEYKALIEVYNNSKEVVAQKEVTIKVTDGTDTPITHTYTAKVYKKTASGFEEADIYNPIHILKNQDGETSAYVYVGLRDENNHIVPIKAENITGSSTPNNFKIDGTSPVSESGEAVEGTDEGAYIRCTIKANADAKAEKYTSNCFYLSYDGNDNIKSDYYSIYFHERIDDFTLRLMEKGTYSNYTLLDKNELTFEKPVTGSVTEKIFFGFVKNDETGYLGENYFTPKVKSIDSNGRPNVTIMDELSDLSQKKGVFEAELTLTPDTETGKYNYDFEFDTTSDAKSKLGEYYNIISSFDIIVTETPNYSIKFVDNSGNILTDDSISLEQQSGSRKSALFSVFKDNDCFNAYDEGYYVDVKYDEEPGYEARVINISGTNPMLMVIAYPASKIGTYPLTLQLKKHGNNSVLAEKTINVTITEASSTTEPQKPTLSVVGDYTYNGDYQTAVVNGYNIVTMNIKGNEEKDAGTYTITVTPRTKWADGTTDPVTATWTIKKCVLKTPVLTQNIFEYTGSSIKVTDYLTNFDKETMFITGKTEESAIYNSYYTFSIKAKDSKNCTFVDKDNNEISELKYYWKITKLYTITVNGGTATPATAEDGATVTIKATVPDDKEFLNWTSNDDVVFADETKAETTFTMLGKNVTVTANFKDKEPTPVEHTVTAYGLYGETMGITPGEKYTMDYAVGERVALQIGKRSGYKLKGITLKGIDESDISWYLKDSESKERGIVFDMPDNNVMVTVNWKKNSSSGGGSSLSSVSSTKYAVTSPSVENGEVIIDKANAAKGSDVTIMPKADEGYELGSIMVTDRKGNEIKLTDNGDGTYTFTMPESKVNIDVSFKKIESDNLIKMTIGSIEMSENGRAFYNDVAPVIVDNRTMVPIRVITELLGGTADWNEATKEVTLTIDGKVIRMTVGVVLEKYGVAPVIINDRTYVPIRFVADELGAETDWDEATNTVTIYTANK